MSPVSVDLAFQSGPSAGGLRIDSIGQSCIGGNCGIYSSSFMVSVSHTHKYRHVPTYADMHIDIYSYIHTHKNIYTCAWKILILFQKQALLSLNHQSFFFSRSTPLNPCHSVFRGLCDSRVPFPGSNRAPPGPQYSILSLSL